MKTMFAAAVLALFFLSSCSIIPNASKRKYNPLIKYIGVCSVSGDTAASREPRLWNRAVDRMENSFPGSEPMVIWTVGRVNPENSGVTLDFITNAVIPRIAFSTNEPLEKYLHYFDVKGIFVFLQVEPGSAPVETLISLVLARSTNHACVAGIGVDSAWYDAVSETGKKKKISDADAQSWEKKVKSFNTNYRLFIKGETYDSLPPTYRGDIVFVNGRSKFRSVLEMADVLSGFADRFYPNLVFFEIGFPADRYWWSKFKKPQERIGDALADKIRQECGIAWTDNTLKESLLK